MTAPSPTNVGSNRQLFLDDYWIDWSEGVTRELHNPVRREAAIAKDKPWETTISYMVAFWDEDRYRAWYRVAADYDDTIAYAESTDGIHWQKPDLGIIDFEGSTKNNIVWAGPGNNMAPFKDPNPDVPDDERYKAFVRTEDILGLVSPDGLHWRLIREEPLLDDGPFDSHNIVFWDTWKNEYVAYTRGISPPGTGGIYFYDNVNKKFIEEPGKGGVRWIRRASSDDFINWSPLELIDPDDKPYQELYTNSCIQYERAPGTYLMFPSRFHMDRMPDPDWFVGPGLSDIVFMSSRDGVHFDRSFLEAFLRPSLDKRNWHERGIYMERGLIETSPTEISIYGMENNRLESVNIRRYSLRTDGFVSVNAGYSGGEFTTHPMVFDGNTLELNYSTSAVGSIQLEIQDADGNSISGRTLDDCPEKFGDEIEGIMGWNDGTNVGSLAGKPVRLRFRLTDADLYAFRFR